MRFRVSARGFDASEYRYTSRDGQGVEPGEKGSANATVPCSEVTSPIRINGPRKNGSLGRAGTSRLSDYSSPSLAQKSFHQLLLSHLALCSRIVRL